jgi:hypothetical protein
MVPAWDRMMGSADGCSWVCYPIAHEHIYIFYILFWINLYKVYIILKFRQLDEKSGGWGPYWLQSARWPLNGLLYLPRMIVMMADLMQWRLAGKPKYLEKTCPSATLSVTYPTWPDLGSNPGCCGGKPATNHLSYGAALSWMRIADVLIADNWEFTVLNFSIECIITANTEVLIVYSFSRPV